MALWHGLAWGRRRFSRFGTTVVCHASRAGWIQALVHLVFADNVYWNVCTVAYAAVMPAHASPQGSGASSAVGYEASSEANAALKYILERATRRPNLRGRKCWMLVVHGTAGERTEYDQHIDGRHSLSHGPCKHAAAHGAD